MAMAKCRECGKVVSTEAGACPHCGASKPVKSQMGIGSMVGIGLILIMMVGCLFGGGNDQEGATAADPNAVAFDAQMEGAMRGLITAAGFECPRVATVRRVGTLPDGAALRVRCGPAGQEGVYMALHYEVIPDKLIVRVVQ